jgi:RNA polymerase sigma-70 factor (ECF subfamily)
MGHVGIGGNAANASDGALVRRTLDGEAHAFGTLVDRYVEQFGKYATSLCRDADIAADAMQEAFIRAYDRLTTLKDPEQFGAWFFRILTNQCHNHRDRRRTYVPLDSVAVSGGRTPDQDLTAAETKRAIDAALDTLTPDLRTTFVLREIEGRSYAEIAALLNTGEPALRKRVERAKDVVRAALEEWT